MMAAIFWLNEAAESFTAFLIVVTAPDSAVELPPMAVWIFDRRLTIVADWKGRGGITSRVTCDWSPKKKR